MINNGNEKAAGRIAVPPPIIRKINGAIASFLRIIITSLLASTSAPIRNGGIVQVGSPVLQPVASPIINSGAVGALIGGGGPLFYAPVRINIDQSSQLYVPPGTDGRIVALLKNDGPGDYFLISGGDDKNFFLQFDYAQYVVLFNAVSVREGFHSLADDTNLPRDTSVCPYFLPPFVRLLVTHCSTNHPFNCSI